MPFIGIHSSRVSLALGCECTVGPGAECESPGGAPEGGWFVADETCCGYFRLAAGAAVLAALEDEEPMASISLSLHKWGYRPKGRHCALMLATKVRSLLTDMTMRVLPNFD